MRADRRIIVASRKTDLTWALHHEIARRDALILVSNVDPRARGAVDRIAKECDIVVIEAADFLWLWSQPSAPGERLLAAVRTVVVLAEGDLLDVFVRARGRCGVLLRAIRDGVPADSLEVAILGYIVISPALLATLARDGLRLAVVDALSDEEREVLAQLGRARTNRRIAAEMGYSESRVKTLVHLVTHKLRLPSRTGVAVFAMANGFDARASRN
jgi:DNA-binding NarL/FixJ family response regulator